MKFPFYEDKMEVENNGPPSLPNSTFHVYSGRSGSSSYGSSQQRDRRWQQEETCKDKLTAYVDTYYWTHRYAICGLVSTLVFTDYFQ